MNTILQYRNTVLFVTKYELHMFYKAYTYKNTKSNI